MLRSPCLCGIAATVTLLAGLPGILRGQDTTAVEVPRVRLPPPIPPPWRFQIDVGFQDVTGNRDLTVANAVFIVDRRPGDRLILNMKLEGRYGRSNGVEAVNYQLARVRFDWNPRNIVSPFLGLDMIRDPVRKSAFRIQGGAGANVNLDIREASRTSVSFGIVADHQVYTAGVVPATTDEQRWMFRATTQRLIGPGTRMEGVAKLQPRIDASHDYLAVIEASVRVALSRRIGLTTKMEWSRDSRPPDGVKPDDRSLTAAFSIAW
jgi:hypothetical protein